MKNINIGGITIPCYPSVTAFVNDQNRIRKLKEDDMNKGMGHFTDWKFGVPVKVIFLHNNLDNYEGRLIHENKSIFRILTKEGVHNWYYKSHTKYELIPYENTEYPGLQPRYPVCESLDNVIYCNSLGKMSQLYCVQGKRHLIKAKPPVTIDIDGKTITLSDETVAELKRKLGV